MKQNKIKVIVEPDSARRRKEIQKAIIDCGLALTPGDANKLIRPSIDDYDLRAAYFVAIADYNFRESPLSSARLYQLAARGIAIIVGCRRLPKEYEILCERIWE